MKRRASMVAGLVAFLLALQVSALLEAQVKWVFRLSGKGGFFALPWPTELRREGDGSIRTEGFPNALGLKMIKRTRDAVSAGYGFSTSPGIYFKFDGPINEDALPSARDSLSADSTLFLVDVDPGSKEFGRRFPLESRFYRKSPRLVPLGRNLLATMPAPGFVLRDNTLYAAGVMRGLGDGKGRPLGQSDAVADMAAGRVPEGELGARAFEVYGPVLEALAGMGIEAADLAALTVFRTGDPTARMEKLFAAVADMPLIEFETPLARTREYELYYVLEGAVTMPQFQDGTPPYGHGRGGRIHFDSSGKPVVQRMERVPVCFTVPKGRMPGSGFPIMIYVHGTAGVSTQLVDRGEAAGTGGEEEHGGILGMLGSFEPEAPPGTGPAMVYARRGIAGAGAAQPQNGERGGQPSMIYFYNFLSPEALRDNILQASAEASMLLRLVQGMEIDPKLCPETKAGGPIRFDPDMVFGMGQSLGSLILGPWGGVETELKALIPAGNGAYWRLFMAEGNPLDMNSLRKSGEGLTESLGLDKFHPVIDMLQTVLAPADPFAYQKHYATSPLPGRNPKHVWASFGLYDHYFAPVSQNAAISCMGLDLAGPVLEPSTREALELSGLGNPDYPVSLNKESNGRKTTAVAVQYRQYGALDGHHVNYQRQDAKYQYGCFLETLWKTGAPVVYEPVWDWDAKCGG